MKKIKLLFFVLIFYTLVNFIFSFYLKISLWGFEDYGSQKVLSNSIIDFSNSDLNFSVASHIYEDLSSFDSLNIFAVNNKLNASFILGDVGNYLNDKMNEKKYDLPYDLILIPGNNDISNDKEYYNFVESWGDYRAIQKKNALFLLLNSMECTENFYPHEGCWFSQAQLDFLQKQILKSNSSVDHIFIFTHHIYWWKNLNIFSRLKLSRYAELPINDIFEKFRRGELRAGITRLIKKILFFGKGVIFARNDYISKNNWTLIHNQLKSIDKNIFVIGGDAPFNSHIEKDKVHYLSTGFVSFDWNQNLNKPKEFFNIKIKGNNFQIINEEFFYRSKHYHDNN